MSRLAEILAGPFLGLGLGIDVHGEVPDWRALLARPERGFDFLEVFTRGDGGIAAQVREHAGPEMPLIYHHEGFELVYPGPLSAPSVEAAAVNLEVLGAPWCVEELAYRELDGRYLDFFMPAVLSEESARVAVEKIRAVNERLGVLVTPENPPYQLPVGDMHLLDYMAFIADGAEVPLILDLGHLHSYQLCFGADPLAGLEKLPLDRVIELHVAGASYVDVDGVTIYEDSHGGDLIPETLLDMLAEVGPRCENLKAVTVEVEDAPEARVVDEVARVRAVMAPWEVNQCL